MGTYFVSPIVSASFWSRTRLLGFSVRPNHRVWVSWQNDWPRITKETNLPHSFHIVSTMRHPHGDPWSIELVAGAGLERCDLWVMSPTSYQLLHPANFFIVADERFERPNTGVRVLCLTSLANRQYSSHKRIRTPISPCSRALFQ